MCANKKYDISGRAKSDSTLDIPLYKYISDTEISFGELK
jgi:hypothetical protein